jgi:pimeloyl-ACP methyl ester carboxylesterase
MHAPTRCHLRDPPLLWGVPAGDFVRNAVGHQRRNGGAHRGGSLAVALLLLATMGAGCASGVGATRVSGREADRMLAANVLATGEPSAWSLQTLHHNDLLDVYREDRVAALQKLHASLAEPELELERVRERLFALSELSFDHARREDERFLGGEDPHPWFLASAVYALGFVRLEPGGSRDALALDSRTRLAADLYNRGVTDGLQQDGVLRIEDGERPLPFGGTLSLDLDEASLRWGSFLLTDFVPTAELRTYGIANRYRHAGIGAPLAAGVVPAPDASGADVGRIGSKARVPSTLLMFVDFSLEALQAGELKGRLELHTADVARDLTVGARTVPLEVDATAALAMRLDRLKATTDTTRAFLTGDLSALSPDEITDQLAMFTPYRKGRIPVVFVHGTYSDPSTWAEMLNELENDPVLSDRLQFWFFFYASGNPIGYSGGLLAQALRNIKRDLNPEGSDPALDQMVVIGHSQGGLLTKLTVVDSGPRFWNGVFDEPADALDVEEETRVILERSLHFAPIESVSRVVFISTPHGGSFLTTNPISDLLKGLITMPATLSKSVFDVVTRNPHAAALGSLETLPTSIDNMRPGNPFLETLRSLPVVDGVAVHSIVAVQGDGPDEELSDGVVQYKSAHITQGTERRVKSGHSAQVQPAAIAEVRRILREHLDTIGAQAQ